MAALIPLANTSDIALFANHYEIGAAEVHKASAILSAVNMVPQWPANLEATVNQMQANINNLQVTMNNIQNDIQNIAAEFRAKFDQLPILFANSQAGPLGPLRDPSQVINGYAPYLNHPNPQTRDELLGFTAMQCEASAAALGLPALPPAALVQERCRQLAIALGIVIE